MSPSEAPFAIEAHQLSKVYREGWIRRKTFQALNEVSFQVRSGCVFGLLGPNGAGKTTFVKTLIGIIRKTSGDATVFGYPAGSRKARRELGYLPERLALPSYLTGYQCLEYCGGLSGLSAGEVKARRDEILSLVGLDGWGKTIVRKYSKGMMQRLGLAQAMLHQPKLLILDEPTDGLDPKARAGVRQILHRLASQGVTIFLNSHLLQEVEQICQDVAIMAEGTVRYCGPVGEVANAIQKKSGGESGLRVAFRLSGDPERIAHWQQSLEFKTPEFKPLEDGSLQWLATFQEQTQIDQQIDLLRKHQISLLSLERKTLSLEDSFLQLVGHDLPSMTEGMTQAGKRG